MIEHGLWTLDELTERVAQALSAGYSGPPSARIRELPNQRAIRWYTTRGLIDPPVAMRGRQALYTGRHLLQLVAVKQLQARGLTLAQVQTRLTGLPDPALRALVADGPGDITGDITQDITEGITGDDAGQLEPAGSGHSEPDGTGPGRVRFWVAGPVPAPAASAPIPVPASAPASAPAPTPAPVAGGLASRWGADRRPDPDGTAELHTVRLAPGVLLVLDAAAAGIGPLPADDLLRAAAQPLHDLLTRSATWQEGDQP